MLVGIVAPTLAMAQTTASDALPKWEIATICAKESAPGQCREFEAQAFNAISASWSFVPAALRKQCLESAASPPDQSYRLLSSCLENAYDKAGGVRAAIATAADKDPADVAALRPKPVVVEMPPAAAAPPAPETAAPQPKP